MEGKCSICGEIKNLTYEHIPPKKAGNSKAKIYQGYEQLFNQKSDLYGKNRQARQGFGKYCLCENCNNTTGSLYAKDYIDFVKQCIANFENHETLYDVNELEFTIKPLNVLKQIAAMFMCVAENTLLDIDQFKDFVLNKENQVFPDKYRVHLFTTWSRYCRYNGMTIISQDLEVFRCAEIVHRPFGLQLTYDSKPTEEMVDITDFCMGKYDQEATIILTTKMLDIEGSPFPGSYVKGIINTKSQDGSL